MRILKLIIFSIIGITFFACSIEDNFVNNQEYLSQKNIKFKNISYDEFNKKTNFVKNKPNLDGLRFKNNNVFSRTEGENSEYIIYTDKISEVNKDEYTSYTMLLKTPNSSENIFYNIIFEIKNEMTTIFIVKYTKSNNGFLDELITTYRSSEDFLGGGSNLLQVYIEDFENAVGSVGTPTSTGSGGMNWSSLGGSTIYPTDCNGTVSTTYVLEPHNCASNTHSPSQINDCEYLNPNYEHYDPSKGPYTELITYFTCIPSPIEGNNNPPTGDNSLNGGNSSTTSEENSSFTAITTDENECVVPRGDLNNDCILDQDESNFVTFLENLTTEERRLVNEDNNLKISFFNFLKGQSWSNESKIFATQFIQNSILSGLNLDFEKSLKSPANIDFSEIDKTTPEGQKLDCIYQKLMQSASFKNLFVDTFGGPQTRLNVKFEIADNLPFNIYGNCRLTTSTIGNNVIYTNIIRINKNKLDDSISNIIIAQTILHESIHAYLNIKKINCNLGSTITELNGLDLQSLIGTFYQSFGCHIDVNGSPQSQHVFILDFMIPVFENTLSGIKDSLINQNHQTQLLSQTFYNPITNENESFNWNDFFQYIGLLGLQNTQTFQDNIQSDSLKFTKFNFYLSMANMATRNCN